MLPAPQFELSACIRLCASEVMAAAARLVPCLEVSTISELNTSGRTGRERPLPRFGHLGTPRRGRLCSSLSEARTNFAILDGPRYREIRVFPMDMKLANKRLARTGFAGRSAPRRSAQMPRVGVEYLGMVQSAMLKKVRSRLQLSRLGTRRAHTGLSGTAPSPGVGSRGTA